MQWTRPDGLVLDLQRLTDTTQELLDRLSGGQGPQVDAEALPFELMPVTPDSAPWRKRVGKAWKWGKSLRKRMQNGWKLMKNRGFELFFH